LDSVLAQTLPEIEIIMVDDGSTDHTASWIEQRIMTNPVREIRLVRQTNSGVAAARNRGISEARGRFILPLDADDLIERTMLKESTELLETNPDLGVVYTDRQDFGDIERIWTAGRFDLQHLKYFNQIAYCCMFRKSMWEDIKGYRTNVSGFDDWDFWLAAVLRGFKGKHLPKPFLKHRRRKDSLLWRILDQYERLFAQIILNNRAAYSDTEVAIAERFISYGEVSSMLRSSRFIFMSRYYEGYPCGY
jgi:glycosyltransferase involved in cell wall biosynthesis